MKKFSLILTVILMGPAAFPMDEADIPPPPMPEYMQGQNIDGDRSTASENSEVFNDQSAESIREEFLQAGEADEVSTPEPPPAEPEEAPLDEIAEQESIEQPAEVYETPSRPAPMEEVSEVDVAEPEFEQATINASEEEQAKNDFQADVGNVVNETPTASNAEEVLADVEENLEQAEQEAEEVLAGARTPSNKKSFKSGMYKFSEECTMYSEPRSLSDVAGKVPAGRKLWIDGHDDNWRKAYKKSGAVYIPADCLQ